MRATSNDKGWLLSEAGVVQGLALGFDFCAEHEWGVKPLKLLFGLDDKRRLGLAGRKIEQLPAGCFVYAEYQRKPRDKRRKPEPCALLAVSARGFEPDEFTVGRGKGSNDFYSDLGDSWHKPERDNLACAWGDSEFLVRARGEENIARLQELRDAFQKLDIALGGVQCMGWQRAGGLVFVIASRVPAEEWANVEAKDLDQEALIKAWTETGIEERLRKAGRNWYALSPRWANDEKTSIVAWLNPTEQAKFSYGWFGIEDLDAWARGEGPIMQVKKKA
jgi:hypothetical protein